MVTKMMSVKTPVSEKLINDAPRTFTEASFPVGSVAHQGDLILIRLDGLPVGAKPRKNRQMVTGNTQGSRHILRRGNAFDCDLQSVAANITAVCPGIIVAPAYIGPVFQSRNGVADLTHPEHGNHTYRGDMTIAVVYQRNLDAEERERRTID
jgi:hypothetical protein